MSTQPLRDELAEIFAALQIHDWYSFSFRNAPPICVGTQPAGMASAGDARTALLNSLRDVLYGSCYTRNYAPGEMPASQYLVPQLMQANQTPDRWDPGWSIYQLGSDGRVSVQKGERSRTALIGEYATNKAPGMPPQVGDQVNLRVYPGSAELQPGFYFSFGSTLSDQFDEYALLRFYFNVRAEGAAELLRTVTGRMNHYAIPYRYKTLTDAAAYTRADAAVLYVARRYFHIVASLLEASAETLSFLLRPETPMFCKTLRPGIGLAEEPGTGESFGMHRCRLLAEGVLDAWMAGQQSAQARMEAVEKCFAAGGLDLDLPYLNARSADLYTLTDSSGGIAA